MVNYWLWVEKEGGIDEEMIPGETWHWFGCDYDTEEGDLILIYRTLPYKHIQYLVRATSDSQLESKYLPDEIYKCDFEVLYDFGENSLKIDVMRNNNKLSDWYPLKVSFVKMKFPIEEDYWEILKEILLEKNPDSQNEW